MMYSRVIPPLVMLSLVDVGRPIETDMPPVVSFFRPSVTPQPLLGTGALPFPEAPPPALAPVARPPAALPPWLPLPAAPPLAVPAPAVPPLAVAPPAAPPLPVTRPP